MVLDHERLDVYVVALDFLVFANEVIERLPRGRSHLADQLTLASTSIVLNLAEGAGKLSKADKRRYYLTARGSATESAALLDVCLRLRLVGEAEYSAGKAMLPRRVHAHQARDELRGHEADHLEPSDTSRFGATTGRSRWRLRPRSCAGSSRSAWQSGGPA